MEPEFWEVLGRLVSLRGGSITSLVQEIDEARKTGLSSAVRVFILKELQKKS